jgi:ribosomal protein S18 acetylase RimI-like enzyme
VPAFGVHSKSPWMSAAAASTPAPAMVVASSSLAASARGHIWSASEHIRSKATSPPFSLIAALLRALHSDAYHAQNLAKTYGLFCANAPQKVIGYITLVCGQIETETEQKFGADIHYFYDHCPAVKIARLAVDSRFMGRGLGTELVDFALGVVKLQICPWVGCRFIVVDSKKSAVRFYEERCGFTQLDTDTNRRRDAPIMFIDLHKVDTKAQT